MSKYLKQIKSLKKISKQNIINNKFLINSDGNIKIYYAQVTKVFLQEKQTFIRQIREIS